MKKRIILVILIVIVLGLVLLVPLPVYLKDGGSIEYRALLYTVTKYHQLAQENEKDTYKEGIGIKILGMEVYNNTKEPTIESKEENNEPKTTTEPIHHSFVGTVLEETTTYMIVEPNEDEEERKSADKIKIDYGTDHIDYVYGIGRKVIINYTGYIKETYPAQIETDDILLNGYEEFELSVKEANNKKKTKILSSKDLDKNDFKYDLYYYGIDEVEITINNNTMSLEEALKSGKMTLDGLVIRANKDFPNATTYKDGGSIEYHYENYTIIKMHTLSGNRDVYIGTKDMTMTSIN